MLESVGFWSALLGVAAVALFVIGFVLNSSWSPLWYSLGLAAVVVLLYLNWVPLASWVGVVKYADSPSNGVILCKLIVALLVQLGTIYYSSKSGFPIIGAAVLGLSAFGWMQEEAIIYDSDPAGNGMARGFGFMIDIFLSVVLALIFFLVMKFVKHENTLLVCMALLTLYFGGKVFCGYYSRTRGRYAAYEKRQEELDEKMWKQEEVSYPNRTFTDEQTEEE